jgi:hypothetical protein
MNNPFNLAEQACIAEYAVMRGMPYHVAHTFALLPMGLEVMIRSIGAR